MAAPARPADSTDKAMASRLLTLGASVVAALCAGTNYSFSAYAPQLGSRLGITHTKLNIIGLAGNYGAHISGPIWGRVIDANGPRLVLFAACAFLFCGYYGTKDIYDMGPPPGSTTISITMTVILVLFKAMTGSGGNAGFSSGMNSTAKSFSASLRATAVGVVASGFGLSALLFSTISRVFLAGKTSSFLSLLAFGTSIPMIIGSFLIKPIPQPTTKPSPEETGYEVQEEAEPLLSPTEATQKQEEVNVYGARLAKSLDFWLIFTIMSLLAGSGLTYINNVGSMARALYSQGNPDYDPREADIWQGSQVSVISFMNFSGRILIGPISDLARNRLGLPRSYCMVPIAFLMLSSQLAVLNIERVEVLWAASSMIGSAYGSIYALFPNVSIEWFGMPHFSENWGYIALSPIVSSNVFALIFGRIMDAHSPKSVDGSGLIESEGGGKQCLEGRKCYSDALFYTSAGCLLALVLSVWAAYRDRRRIWRGVRK